MQILEEKQEIELKKASMETGLYIVPTPLGNLEDITLRAIRVLQNAEIIACEDTRNTGKLLNSLNLKHGKLCSYHNFNERDRANWLLAELSAGKSVALVSDAGYPGISDPGYRIIQSAIENGIRIFPLPGPTAFVPALVASGLSFDKFTFFGFLPQKKGRKKALQLIAQSIYTVILYESPFRIIKLCKELNEFCGKERRVCFAREISKVYEEFIRGNLEEVELELSSRQSVKGEFVVIISGNEDAVHV